MIETSFSEKQWSQLGPEILNWGKSKVRKRSIPKKDIFDNLRFSCKYLDFGSFLTEEFETLFTKEPILLPLIEREQLFFWNSLLKKTFSIAFERSWWVANFSKAFRESSSSKFYHVLHFKIFEILNHFGFHLKSRFLTNEITINNNSKVVRCF